MGISFDYRDDIDKVPLPSEMMWHSEFNYLHLGTIRSPMEDLGVPEMWLRNRGCFSLAPWTPKHISPSSLAIIFGLSASTSSIKDYSARGSILAPLANDLLLRRRNTLEEDCDAIWEHAYAIHAAKRACRGCGSVQHALTPKDLLDGLNAWVVENSSALQHLGELYSFIGVGGITSHVLKLSLSKEEACETPWPLLMRGVAQNSYGRTYDVVLGRAYQEFLSNFMRLCERHLWRAAAAEGELDPAWGAWIPGEELSLVSLERRFNALSKSLEELLKGTPVDQLSILGRSLSPQVLDELAALAEEYNVEWALAAYDWDAHGEAGEIIAPEMLLGEDR